MIREGMYIAVSTLIKKKIASLTELSERSGLSERILRKLLSELSVKFDGDQVVACDVTELIIRCWKMGMDPSRLAIMAEWKEFEQLCSKVFNLFGFETITNLRFNSAEGLRFEIDIVATRRPYALVVDCKRWTRLRASHLKAAAELQKRRSEALARKIYAIPRIRTMIKRWKTVEVTPLIVNLHECPIKLHEGVPLVPLHKLGSFLNELEAYRDEIYLIRVDLATRLW